MSKKTPTPTGPDKAALARFEAAFTKSFGAKSLVTPGPPDVVSTGSPLLDFKLGCGGIPVGKIVESYGPESTGKTTMALLYAAQFQRRFPDRSIGWVDMERSYLPDWAQAHGVDPHRLIVTQPDTAEDVADQVKMLMETGFCSMIVLDSIGGMIAQKEFDKDAGEAVVGLIAKIITRTVRIAAVRGQQNDCTFHMINQVRANISSYGGGVAPGGGHARAHAASIQIQHRALGKDGRIEIDDELVGQTFALTTVKNKLAPPRRTAMVTLLNQPTEVYGPVGINLAAEAFELGKLAQVFGRRGSWFDLPDGTSHNGEKAVLTHLRTHPEVIEQIREAALATVAHTVVTDPLKEGTA